MNNCNFQVLMDLQWTTRSPRLENVKSLPNLTRYVFSVEEFSQAPKKASCTTTQKEKKLEETFAEERDLYLLLLLLIKEE